MTTNDLIAILHEAMHELDVMGSYAYDPDVQWPSYGLKVTSAAHGKLAKRIKALLDTGPAEEVPLREENRALRAALRSKMNDEEWRLKYLEAKLEAERMQVERDEMRAELKFIKTEYGDAEESTLTQDALLLRLRLLTKDRDEANAELVLHKEERLRLRTENMRLQRLLVEARDVIAANRLVLGEYMGPEHISKLTDKIDAAVPKKLKLDLPENWNAYNASEGK